MVNVGMYVFKVCIHQFVFDCSFWASMCGYVEQR